MPSDDGDAPPDNAPPDNTPSEPAPPAAPLIPLYLPIYILTGVFGAIFIIGPLLIRKGPNKQIIRYCIMMATFFMWIFWVTVYIAQMNPLTSPRLRNDTLIWIAFRDQRNLSALKALNEDDDADNDDS